MANESTTKLSYVAAADLSAKQYYAVRLTAADTVNVGTVGGKVVGVLDNAPASGRAASVNIAGRSNMIAGTTIAAGQTVESDGSGTAQPKTADGYTIGIALESATVGELFEVQLMLGKETDGIERFVDDGGITAGLIVQTGTADGDVAVADADAKPFGVAATTSLDNAPAHIYVSGVCEVTSGAAFAKGASLTSDANGKAVAAGTGGNRHAVGYALDAATGADESITMIVAQHLWAPDRSIAELTDDGGITAGLIVESGTADNDVAVAGLNGKPLGVAAATSLNNATAFICVGGKIEVTSGAAFTRGDALVPDAAGKARSAGYLGGRHAVGYALDSATGADESITCLVMPHELKSDNTSKELTAGADLSAKQKFAVKVGAADDEVILSTAGDLSVGILQNAPTAAATAIVATSGVAVGTSGAAITLGAEVEADANGKIVDATGTNGNYILGIALNDTAGADEDVNVLLHTREQVAGQVTGVAAGYKLARGIHTTVAATDTVVSGLTTVVAVVVTEESDPALDPLFFTADIGDQVAAPAAGSFYLKSWQPTAANDVTPIAATTFAKEVNWIAIGT